jgi:RNA polymerase sigma-70 factor (ECF subfamily)
MDEQELIRQMKSGDRASFDRIYEKYRTPIFRSAYLICGNRADAEDVLQDTFVTCWLCIGQLRKEESFRYWLFRIMTQAARKRAKERSRQLPDEDIVNRIDQMAVSSSMEAADEYERTSDKTVLEAALSALDQASREVVVLYYYEEMSVREVAKTLRLLEGTVKSRLYFARRKMKKILQEGVRREK